MSAATSLSAGQIVRVRQRQYLVEDVTPGRAGEQTLVRLACIEDDAQGQELEVLWEKELDREVITEESWEEIARRGFDKPHQFAGYLDTLRWNCVTSTDASLFQSPFRAGIKLDAYQLEPLRKALRLPRVNLFIADDVGLGKTIEAGLIVRELLLRKKAREIVVCCPPSMLYQWRDELETRFGLTFEILDKEYVKRVRSERGFSVNPWGTHTRFLISHRLLIDDTYAAPLRDWLDTFRPGTMFILDEAHHAAPSSGQKYAIDSQITRSVRDLAQRFEHRLFLSATPHNGHSNSFSALLEILDPQRFCRGVKPMPQALDDIMVRRLKDDIRAVRGGFPKREVVQVDLDGLPADAPELLLAELLDQYATLRETRLAGGTRRSLAAARLLITGLQQRLLSSVEAFSRTLHVHKKTVQRHYEAARAGEQLFSMASNSGFTQPVGQDDDRAEMSEEELAADEDAQIAALSGASAGEVRQSEEAQYAREQQLLARMTEVAEAGRYEADARIRHLIAWIRQNQCPALGKEGAPWTNIRVLIFTEYEDTRRYLCNQIRHAIESSDRAEQRIEVFQGSTSSDKREEIKRAFNADPTQHPVRILIATDAAREGLNLQAHCWNLFHFDVPWNPSRMEQRNGRIDRKLQPSETVNCHYFVHLQRPEDRVLQVLVRKTKTIREELGSLAQVVDAQLESTLKHGIRRNQIGLLEKSINTAHIDSERRKVMDEELESARLRQDDLKAQIQTLQDLLEKSQQHIGLTEGHFRQAVSSSLELLGATRLQQQSASGIGSTRFVFPPLDQRADTTWADTMDTLRTPRGRDQKTMEWRKESPIRPVVFEDPGTMTDEVVHIHLEHRVVQRLLGRFIAQGFVYHDLARACLTQTRDAIPRVILLGRLALYGHNAARLHEEMIAVTARWIDPTRRQGQALKPYGHETESKTLDLLNVAFGAPATNPVNREVEAQLQASAPGDIVDLLPELDKRAREHEATAREALRQRAHEEAASLKLILENQRAQIREEIKKLDKESRDNSQRLLDFAQDERDQLEANRKHWDKRLPRLEEEIKNEPTRILEQYTVAATRIEPIGLVYLWPVTG